MKNWRNLIGSERKLKWTLWAIRLMERYSLTTKLQREENPILPGRTLKNNKN